MSSNAFTTQIQTLEQRVDELQRRATNNPESLALVLPEAFEELQTTLEELHVADEELRQQSEELLATRLAVETQHQRYQELFDFAPDGYLVTDAVGVIQEANRAAVTMLAWPREELLGKPLVVLVADADRKAFHTQLTRLQTRERLQDWEVRLSPRQGAPFQAAITVATVRHGSGTVVGLRWLLRDITARKRAEEALKRAHHELERRVAQRTAELQRLNAQLQAEISQRQHVQEELFKARKIEALGVLAGGIAHDFNNILTAVFGNISLAKMYLDPHQKSAAFLTEAETVRQRAMALTHKLLTFAKGGAPVRRPTAIANLIKEATEFASRGSKVTYDLSLPADLWPVEVDQGQMHQVLYNVLTNAEQAMPQDGMVRVQAENVMVSAVDDLPLPEGRYLKLCVSDQGNGILAEHLPNLFDPYFTTKPGHSGLGLTIAYAIVTKHAGYMTVASAVGVGTTVMIYLPASQHQALPVAEVDASLSRGTGKLLVMDDEPALRELVRHMLSLLGYEADCAQDGAEALRLFEHANASDQPYAAVILDLTVHGGMGGRETIAKLRSIDPQVHAIVSSGYSTDPVMADYQQYGFSAAVAKPYTVAELSDVLRRVLLGQSDRPPEGKRYE